MPLRTCTTCSEDKDDSEFRVVRQARHGKEYASRRFECKACENKKSRAYSKANRETETFKERNRRLHLKKYGLTPQDYADLLQKQGGVCAICGNDNGEQRLAVDHNHETGVVRGLLCNPCNRGIGLMGDNPARLLSAADYLIKAGG